MDAADAGEASVAPGGRRLLVAAVLVAALTFVVYVPALSGAFVNWDDNLYVYENAGIQTLTPETVTRAFTEIVANNWHPLTMISYAVDHAVWGLDPFGYHLVNVVLHALNTALVCVLVTRLVECRAAAGSRPRSGALIAGVVTAVLFGLHPQHVESVAWISERKDVLCGLFFLLSLIAYLSYVRTGPDDPGRRWLRYGATLALFVLALLSKPMAVALPLVLLILDFYPLGRIGRSMPAGALRTVVIEKIPFVVLSLLSSLVTVFAQSGAIKTVEMFPLAIRMLIAARAYVFYLVKMVLPLDLAPFYPYDTDLTLLSFEYAGSLVLIGAITALCIVSLRRTGLLSAVWLYYLVTLVPVIGIVQVGSQMAADRYTYLPSLGPLLLVGVGVAALHRRARGTGARVAMVAAGVLVTGALAYGTVAQIAIWREPLTLWSHQIELYPDDIHSGYYNRAEVYRGRGEIDEAMADYTRAVQINPRHASAYNNRGVLRLQIGAVEPAIDDFGKAIEIDPGFWAAHHNRGLARTRLRLFGPAIEDYTRALEIDASQAVVHVDRGNVYRSLGEHRQAIADYDRAIEIDPRSAPAHKNRGHARFGLQEHARAIADLTTAVEIDPEYARAYCIRALAHAALGDPNRAIADFRKATEIEPGFAEAHYQLGLVYASTGDEGRAVASMQVAARLGSRQAAAWLSGRP